MKYVVESNLGSMIYIPNFMKIGAGFQTILNNFRVCNVGIAVERDL
jgi:hypothetical protein